MKPYFFLFWVAVGAGAGAGVGWIGLGAVGAKAEVLERDPGPGRSGHDGVDGEVVELLPGVRLNKIKIVSIWQRMSSSWFYPLQ